MNMFSTISELLAGGEDLVLATIIRQSGSTPRSVGTRMIVHRDGRTVHTVGGGLVEAEVTGRARKTFRTRTNSIAGFNLSDKDVHNEMDSVCGGNLEILIEYLSADGKNVSLFTDAAKAVETGSGSTLVTWIVPGDKGPQVHHFLLDADGAAGGQAMMSADLSADLRGKALDTQVPVLVDCEAQQFLLDPCQKPCAVYIFGSGHVSTELARMTRRVDFHTIVLDDRAEFVDSGRISDADRLIALKDFDEAFTGLRVDGRSFVVIITRGHSHDKTILAQALKTPAVYIGMIGSRRKRELIYRTLMDEGFTEADIERVHSPIGLAIDARTPAEIAVSITAELIKVRATQL